jgi:hypothetical protein
VERLVTRWLVDGLIPAGALVVVADLDDPLVNAGTAKAMRLYLAQQELPAA